MKLINKLTLITTVVASFSTNAQIDSQSVTELEQIDVIGEIMPNQKQAFKEAKAVSSKDDLYKSTENIDSVIRSLPGAFTQQDKSSGALSLNIRGETGFGRANTSIDGVVQTFYATSADAANSRAGGSSQFGAVLDPNFIASVDVNRGTFSGREGANTLYGSANFRTLGVNDVVRDGNQFGLLVKGLTGDNETKYNSMVTAATKQWLNNGGYIGILYGYSQHRVSQDYKVGGGVKIRDIANDFINGKKKKDFEDFGLGWDEAQKKWVDVKGWGNTQEEIEKIWRDIESPQWNITPIDPDNLKQKSASHLAKIEYMDDNNTLNLQYRTLSNYVAGRKIENKNYQLNYGFNKGNYVDLNVLLAHNIGKQKYAKGAEFSGKKVSSYLETRNIADIFDLSNTFVFNLPNGGEFKTTAGFNLLKNKYNKNRFPDELGIFNGFDFRFSPRTALPTKTVAIQPSGTQEFNTLYLDNHLNQNIANLDYNVSFVNYKFSGEYADYIVTGEDYIKHFGRDSEIYKKSCDQTEDPVSPSCDIYEPIAEGKGKRSAINHSVTFSADIHPLFTPFVSYSKTHRMPNIQEMFFSQLGDVGVNMALKPEQAQTYQLGFNSSKEGLFAKDDFFGLKLVLYKSRIKNYIHNVMGFWEGRVPDWAIATGFYQTISYRNYQDMVHKKGLELELSYDNGRFYTNLSYAYQKTDQPTNYGDSSPQKIREGYISDALESGFGLTKVSILPRDYGKLDIGTRWFDRKLTLGSSVRYYGKSKRATLEEQYLYGKTKDSDWEERKSVKKTETIDKQPLIVDFYIMYEPISNLVIKAELQNAFNKRYVDPLDASNDSASQRYYTMFDEQHDHSVLNNYARGRTGVLSLSYKF